MPTFVITAPDGNEYEVTGPEGATEEEALAQFQSSYEAPSQDVRGEGVDFQDAKGLSNAISNGFLAGFGDEVIAGARSIADKILPNSEYDFGDDVVDNQGNDYSMYLADQRAVDDEFRRENPGIAIGAEIAGSIVSPINKIAPGVGRTGSTLRKTLESMGRGTLEGGVVGFAEGRGSLEDRIDNARKGASIGGLMSGAISGTGGALGRTISKRRIARELGKGDDFVPANIADPEGGAGAFVRKYIGNAIGGRGQIGRQESSYFRNNPRITGLVEDGESLFPNTVGTRHAVKNLKDKITEEATLASDTLNRQQKAIPAAVKGSVSEIDQQGARQLFDLAMPDTMPQEIKDQIRSLDYDQGEELLSKWWGQNGFKTVKGRDFDWDAGLRKELKSLSENDPVFALVLGDAAAKVDGLVNRLVRQGKKLEDLVPQDYIDELSKVEIAGINGDALMELRNTFARPANKGGPNISGKMQRQIVKKFDDMIKGQLGDQAPLFQSELDSWGAKQGVSGAAAKARKKGQEALKSSQIGSSLRNTESNKTAFKVLKQTEKAKRLAQEQASKQQSRLANTRKRMAQRAKSAKNRVDREASGILDNPPSSWSQLASTAILGAPVSFGVGAVPAGVAIATGLGSQTGQRLIAGQTNVQKMLAEALRSGSTSPITRNISRAAALAATNKDEEEQY